MTNWYHKAMYRLWRWHQEHLRFWSPETLQWAERNNVGLLTPTPPEREQ